MYKMFANIKKNPFLILAVIIVLIFSISKTIEREEKKKQFELNNNYVIGEITDHKVFGNGDSYYIYYKYIVNGIEYSKCVNNSFKYSDCEKTRSCIGLRHVVYYDINNPNDAFMDFNYSE